MEKGKLFARKTRSTAYQIAKSHAKAKTAVQVAIVCIRMYRLVNESHNESDQAELEKRLGFYQSKAKVMLIKELTAQLKKRDRDEVRQLDAISVALGLQDADLKMLIRKAYNACDIPASKKSDCIVSMDGERFVFSVKAKFFGKDAKPYVLDSPMPNYAS